ncbi:class D beta-lactamase [Phreatobacter stygius]|uniref:Beta-lactamase n=1 Tax=Phreatobacter stygius TaxID=1940610 RepID=A0A4D7AV14_9HYPH|nr:class D beta-lactamase [Phreatobacter stygius]QCI63561.1 class D beta-lactamase [Phreatobacter stygius]
MVFRVEYKHWTRRSFLGAAGGCALGLGMAGSRAGTPRTVERDDLVAQFQSRGAVGTFALYDVSTDRLTLVNAARAMTRYVPASSFKIANSLIALETGVVADENEIIPYGGKPQPFKAWEKDMPMREAITASNVPVYQELARRIGLERYHFWLDRLGYGNRQTGTALETFWLDGPLEISAVEQARFAARVGQQNLPLSSRSQSIVRDILKLESKDGRTLYGKTGWRFSSNPQLGWWTGWVDQGGKVTAFSLNIDMPSPQDAAKRVVIGRAMLEQLGVF